MGRYRVVVVAVLAALLVQLFPSSAALPALAQGEVPPPLPTAVSEPATPPAPPPPQSVPLATTTADPLPGLTFAIDMPNEVRVGDTVPFTLTLLNRATSPGEDVVVALPLPDGASLVSGDGETSSSSGWRWRLGHLEPRSERVLSGSLRLERLPQGRALLLVPQASARGLATPATAEGGALVLARDDAPREASFTPGSAAELVSADGQVNVKLPTAAFKRKLRLRHERFDQHTPRRLAKCKHALAKRLDNLRGFGTFFLEATDPSGNDIHHFDTPLSITIGYSPEQLRVLGVSEANLTLLHFDQDACAWVTVPTSVDPTTHTATAFVDHFSPFNLSDLSSPSSAFIPSLQGFQASGFTGAAAYSLPIELPSGPGGLKPALSLSYSSAATDGSGGTRKAWQAGPVGKGWTLDAAGSLARNTSQGSSDSQWDHFTLSFGGRSFDMVRGSPLDGNYTNLVGSNWTWHSVDEQFVKLRRDTAADKWTAWSKDGTRYEFTLPLRWGTDNGTSKVYETYKWLLSRVVDPSGNAITYDYQIDQVANTQNVQPTSFLRSISWGYDGATPGTGTPRYRVSFITNSRWSWPTEGVDLDWEFPPSRISGRSGTPHEAYRVDQIRVESWPAGAGGYQMVRAYNLRYAPTTTSIRSDVSGGQPVLTLLGVQRLGSDGSALPETSFSYGTNQGNAVNPDAGWNRLLTIENGQGGRTTFRYEHVWPYSTNDVDWGRYHQNYYRLREVLQEDTSGQSYARQALTTYAYAAPALNDYDHAATVVYARYPDSGNGDSRFALARQEKNEFRGHYQVTERVYDGGTTASPLLKRSESWYYQGNGGTGAATCTPQVIYPASGNPYVPYTDSCYQTMSNRERWKGKLVAQEVWDGNSRLQRTDYVYARVNLPFYGVDGNQTHANQSNNYKRAGLWRAFNYVQDTITTAFEGSGTGRAKTTRDSYDSYGNLTERQTYNESGTLIRKEQSWYAYRDDANTYIVDHAWQKGVRNGGDQFVSLQALFYDNNPTTSLLGTRGLLTRTSAYYDVPLLSSLTGATLHGQDTTFAYDQYGNRQTETTYADASWRTYNGSVPSYGPAGNGSSARTTTTQYDATFHAFPTNVTNALGHVEQAEYDYRLGVLIKVRGPNAVAGGQDIACSNTNSYSIDIGVEITCAQYDSFARLVRLVKPGTSTALPTNVAFYYDSEKPFRYALYSFDGGDVRGDPQHEIFLYYDGLGRKIQTRSESSGYNGEWLVTDARYDALNRMILQSQPRTTPGPSTWWAYVAPGASLYRSTSTTYDALGRTRTVRAPDGTTTTNVYWMGGYGALATDTIDPNNHIRRQVLDSLGRLIAAEQIRGNGGSEGGHSWEGTTSYSYDSLDRLTTVVDLKGNRTSITYDSLGRKTTMSDPDMGSWSYDYDANGNLTRQTDAKGQTTTFGYDRLNRLTAIDYPSGPDSWYGYDNATWPNQKGRRTDTCVALPGQGCQVYQRWEYDGRGRTTFASQSVSGGGVLNLRYTYDSADRLTTTTYEPSNEVVTTKYDGAGRPYSLCTSLGGCYVQAATYDALSQPTARWLGNGASQTWGYSDPIARLFGTNIFAGNGTHLFGRSYGYDTVGNITGISAWEGGNGQVRQQQAFSYDYLDRLVSSSTSGDSAGGYNETYAYDTIGNLVSKGGQSLSYGANGNGTGGGPHQVRSIGKQSYTYDANGNLLSGGGRTYSWNAANQPTSIASSEGGAVVTDGSWQAQALPHQIGRTDGDAWSANITSDSAGFLQYGPYVSLNTAALYAAQWELLIDNNTADSNVVTTLDVYDATTGTVLAKREVVRTDWKMAGQYQTFALDFQLEQSRVGHQLEYRVYWHDQAYIKARQTSVTHRTQATTETYSYNADGERVLRTRNGQNTVYAWGAWEVTPGVQSRKLYSFNGQVVAIREVELDKLTYLHTDHLGSVSVATDGNGNLQSKQEFDPWGNLRSGSIGQTSLNYTGQRRDETGLLFYNARYYDPQIGRFISTDSVVPGNASGGMEGVALRPLTVDFHEPGLVNKLNQENHFGPWFTLSDKEQQQVGQPWGPANPQSLNRYSYVQNNPVRWTDPTGHVKKPLTDDAGGGNIPPPPPTSNTGVNLKELTKQSQEVADMTNQALSKLSKMTTEQAEHAAKIMELYQRRISLLDEQISAISKTPAEQVKADLITARVIDLLQSQRNMIDLLKSILKL